MNTYQGFDILIAWKKNSKSLHLKTNQKHVDHDSEHLKYAESSKENPPNGKSTYVSGNLENLRYSRLKILVNGYNKEKCLLAL